jgi:hypothetical protein
MGDRSAAIPTETDLAADTSQTGAAAGRESQRKPVTIDLAAEEVARKPDQADATEGDAGAETLPEVQAGSGDAREEPIPSAFATSSASSTATAEPVPARGGSSFGALLGAAVIGGVIAGGVLLFLDRTGSLDGILPARQQPGPDLAGEVAALRTDVTALKQNGGQALAPLEQRVAAVEKAVSDLANRPVESGGDAADAALADVQKRLDALEAAAASAGPGDAAAPLQARLTELSNAVDALRSAGSAQAPAAAELTALGSRIEDVSKRLGALEAKPPVDLSGLQAAVAELKGQLSALGGRVDALPTADRVAALETTLKTTQGQAEKAAALGPAVVADALAAALESGRPFTAELAALRGLGLDAAAIDGLAPYGDKGMPTLAALRSEFEEAAAGLDLRTPIPEGTGTMDRLLQSARGLVEVRPAHPTEGADPGAVVARIRGALAAGDLKQALAEWDALPADAKAKTEAWQKQAAARLTADELVARLRSNALSRLGSEG